MSNSYVPCLERRLDLDGRQRRSVPAMLHAVVRLVGSAITSSGDGQRGGASARVASSRVAWRTKRRLSSASRLRASTRAHVEPTIDAELRRGQHGDRDRAAELAVDQRPTFKAPVDRRRNVERALAMPAAPDAGVHVARLSVVRRSRLSSHRLRWSSGHDPLRLRLVWAR